MDFRPRFSYPITIALVAAFLISTSSTPARAAGIGDYVVPFRSLVSTFENAFAQLVALVEPHHTVTVELSPALWHASGKTASAATFNSILATSQPAASPTIVHIDIAPKASPSASHAASVVVAPSIAKAPLAQLASYVTQTDLETKLQQLTNELTSLVYQNVSAPNSVIATGGITNEIAATNRINQLSGVAITGGTITGATINGVSGLTAADIPALAYLSTSGGSLSGALGIGTTSPSDLFALNGAAYLADITVPPVTTNRLYSNSGNLYWAGNLLAGATTGNWSSDGTNVWRPGGNVGIGTTSASALLTIDSNSTLGSIIRLSNSSAGGHIYDFLDTGSANTGGAGRLDFFDKTAGAARLSIAANGNVGVGTTSPSRAFSVSGNEYISGNSTIGGTISAPVINTSGIDRLWGTVDGTPSGVNIQKTRSNGTYDNAVALSVVLNNTDQHAQVLGISNPANLALYGSRDSVATYMSNSSIAPLCTVPNATYTTTQLIPGTQLSASCIAAINRALAGGWGVPINLIIDTASPQYSASVVSVAGDGSSVTVTGWYQQGNTSAGQAPANGVTAYIGDTSNIESLNLVTTLSASSTGFATVGIDQEIDQINNLANAWPVNSNISPSVSAATPQTAGLFISNAGTYRDGEGVNVAGNFYYNYEAHGGQFAAFAATGQHAHDTQDPTYGFYASTATSIPFAYADGSGNLSWYVSPSANMRIGDGATQNVLSIAPASAGLPVIIASTGGVDSSVNGIIATKGQGVVELGNNTLQVGSAAFRAKPVANQVNFIQVQGAISGSPPILRSNGNDPNIDLDLACTGSCLVHSVNNFQTDNAATFQGGFLSNASSTITSGLFSMNGGASTTNFTASGNAYFIGNVGIGTNNPTNALTVTNSRTSGTGVSIGVTQSAPNSTDTGDVALGLSYSLTASSVTNELVNRVFSLSASNNLTGGGTVTNTRVFDVAFNSRAGSNTGNADHLYIEDAAEAGIVTNARGLLVNNLYGTSTAGVAVTNQTIGINNTNLLLGTSAVPSGNYSIYNSSAYNNYFAGNVGVGTTTPGSLFAIGGIANFTAATSTLYSAGGLNITGGCYAVNGTCLTGGGANVLSDFSPTTFGVTNANATSTLLGFTNGIYVLASSTIGNGNQNGGLTINGGATTTGNAYFGGTIQVPAGSSATSSISVTGYPGTGIYFDSAGADVYISQGGNRRFTVQNFGIYLDVPILGRASHAPEFVDGTPSGTSPVLDPDSTDTKAGIGAYAAGNVSIIADNGGTATEMLRVSGTTSAFINGNVAIGTTTPSSRLSVWGVDAASSTAAFTIANSASTTEFQIFDGGNAQLAGTLTQNSDQRLKTNIQSLDASTSLAAINSLIPVAYDWLDPDKGGTRQYGFIAQQVEQVFPNLVSTTSATALTPDGTLGLNYIGLVAPLVEAVQELSAGLNSIASRVSALEATVAGFAQSFTTHQLNADELCLQGTCITKTQLQALLAGQPSIQISAPTPPTISGTSTPPSINIQGSNPATINVGDTYTDLGAIVHDNQGHDLSYRTFINGALSGNILIDTSQVATDTIDYVATDTWGNTATSTRTVIVQTSSSSSSI